LVYTSPLYSDRQDEPQLAICPECLGEIYEYDLRETVGAETYDIAAANILAGVLVPLMPLSAKTPAYSQPGWLCILSL